MARKEPHRSFLEEVARCAAPEVPQLLLHGNVGDRYGSASTGNQAVSAAPGSGAAGEEYAMLQNAGLTDPSAREALHFTEIWDFQHPTGPCVPLETILLFDPPGLGAALAFPVVTRTCDIPFLTEFVPPRIAPYVDQMPVTCIHESDNFQAQDPPSTIEESFMRRAWGTLVESNDIYRWAISIMSGASDAAAVLEYVSGRPEISMTWDACGAGEFRTVAHTDTSVHVCVEHPDYLLAMADYQTPASPGDDVYAVVFYASVLAHELGHLVGISPNESNGTCAETYRIGSTVLWALLQRYPAALNSGRGATYVNLSPEGTNTVDPSLFNQDTFPAYA